MTRTPAFSTQHPHPQDQQYRQPAHPAQPRPPHQSQGFNGQDRYQPPPLPQSQAYQQQQDALRQQQQQHMPPLHAYSTNDLFDVGRGPRNVHSVHGDTQALITTSEELMQNGGADDMHPMHPDDPKHPKHSKHPKHPKQSATDDIDLNPLKLPVYERSQSMFRWIVLFLSCFSMFGSYYCYDNPAALINQFESSDLEYKLSNIQFNLLYTVYSVPNMILPLFGGVLVDKIGAEISMVVFLGLVTGGQAIFAFAASVNNFDLMLVARVVFGLGGESLCVAVSALLAVYFKGKEMAFALGLNLSLARAASSLNDVFTLKFYHMENSVPFALWCGFFLCCVCLALTVLMVVADRYQAKKMKKQGFFVPLAHSGEIVRARDILSFDACYWLLTLSCVVVYGCVLPWNNIGASFLKSKYNYSDSTANSRLMIPYLMSAVCTPFIGYFVDRVGHRAHLLLLSAFALGVTHFLFAWTEVNPLAGLIILGLAYSIYASAIWPAVALVVEESKVGTAYGIITAVQNSGLALVPLAAGVLTQSHKETVKGVQTNVKDYKNTEIFFFGLACLGVAAGLLLLALEPSRGNRLKHASIKKSDDENDEKSASLRKDNEKLGMLANDAMVAREEASEFVGSMDHTPQQTNVSHMQEQHERGNLDHTPINLV